MQEMAAPSLSINLNDQRELLVLWVDGSNQEYASSA